MLPLPRAVECPQAGRELRQNSSIAHRLHLARGMPLGT